MTPVTTALALTGAGVAASAVSVAAVVVLTAVRVRRAEAASVRIRPRPAEAIAVMGGQVTAAGPCVELASRLDHAFELFQQGVAPVIIVSGGIDGNMDEVAGMTDYLVERAVPAGRIAPGRPGHNTRATVQTLGRMGQGCVVVSSPYHAHRIEAELRRQGVPGEVSCSVTPEMLRVRTHRVRFITEVAGSIWYAIPTQITERVPTRSLRHSIPLRFIQRPTQPGPVGSERRSDVVEGPPTPRPAGADPVQGAARRGVSAT